MKCEREGCKNEAMVFSMNDKQVMGTLCMECYRKGILTKYDMESIQRGVKDLEEGRVVHVDLEKMLDDLNIKHHP